MKLGCKRDVDRSLERQVTRTRSRCNRCGKMEAERHITAAQRSFVKVDAGADARNKGKLARSKCPTRTGKIRASCSDIANNMDTAPIVSARSRTSTTAARQAQFPSSAFAAASAAAYDKTEELVMMMIWSCFRMLTKSDGIERAVDRRREMTHALCHSKHPMRMC